MVVLGLVRRALLDPPSGDFDRILLLATPAATWRHRSPAGAVRSRAWWQRSRVRLVLGPAVLAVAVAVAGPADLMT